VLCLIFERIASALCLPLLLPPLLLLLLLLLPPSPPS
jgi:hypothetical protein